VELFGEDLVFRKDGDNLEIVVSGKSYKVDRVVRAFPQTQSEEYISFLDRFGHEVGLLESTDGMDKDSKTALLDHLKQVYFVPTIEEILSVETTGTTSKWTVVTDDGERVFQVLGRESLDGEKPPLIRVTDADGRRYQISNYWKLDKESRATILELLPDKILKWRLVAR
tara:strand:+ start:495 stop:1001 length:507 start_codon:yes stop_codon:yes gene_type:complete